MEGGSTGVSSLIGGPRGAGEGGSAGSRKCNPFQFDQGSQGGAGSRKVLKMLFVPFDQRSQGERVRDGRRGFRNVSCAGGSQGGG